MDKIIDIKKILKETVVDNNCTQKDKSVSKAKTTNPILKKMMSFQNEDISKKFDINDLF